MREKVHRHSGGMYLAIKNQMSGGYRIPVEHFFESFLLCLISWFLVWSRSGSFLFSSSDSTMSSSNFPSK